jgi:CHASE2 domain-containing sensor protein
MPAGGGLETVGFSSIEDLGNPSETAVRDCPVLDKKDRVALQLLVPSPPGFWLASPRRISYERVLSASTGDEALRSMKGKIVLVGATLDRPGMSRSFRDILHVAMGFGSEQRFGIELIADQIAAIERRRVIRPLEGWAQLVLIITMALVGATAQRWGAGRLPLVRLAAFGGLGIAYVLTIVLIYRVSHVLLNVPYEVGACVLAYWGMKRTDWGAPLRDASRRVLRERSMAKEPDGVASR